MSRSGIRFRSVVAAACRVVAGLCPALACRELGAVVVEEASRRVVGGAPRTLLADAGAARSGLGSRLAAAAGL